MPSRRQPLSLERLCVCEIKRNVFSWKHSVFQPFDALPSDLVDELLFFSLGFRRWSNGLELPQLLVGPRVTQFISKNDMNWRACDVPLHDMLIKCVNLTELVLKREDIVPGPFCKVLQYLGKLRKLCLTDTETDNSVLKAVASCCPQLRELDVSECPAISNKAMEYLLRKDGRGEWGFGEIDLLDIVETSVTVSGVAYVLQHSTSITELRHSQLVGAICKLSAKANQKEDTKGLNLSLETLATVTCCSSDNASSTPCSQALPKNWMEICSQMCPKLKTLEIHSFDGRPCSLTFLTMFKHLQKLLLYHDSSLSAQWWPLRALLPAVGSSLTELCVTSMDAFSFSDVAKYCPSLLKLSLSECCHIADYNKKRGDPPLFPCLLEFNLGVYAYANTDAELESLAPVDPCSLVTFLGECPNLRVLKLQDNWELDDDFMRLLVSEVSFHHLRQAAFRCQASEYGLWLFAAHCPLLKDIEIRPSLHVEPTVLDELFFEQSMWDIHMSFGPLDGWSQYLVEKLAQQF